MLAASLRRVRALSRVAATSTVATSLRPAACARLGAAWPAPCPATGIRSQWYHTTPATAAIQPFNLTDIGEGIAEVELLQVYVKPGDKVAQYDRLVEVQSDKAKVDISSPFDGVVSSVAFAPGDIVKTGSTLLLIDVQSADAPGAPAAAASPSSTASKPAPQSDAPAKAPAPSAPGTVVKPFLLTDIGEGIAEVELLQVFVKPGDTVQQYDRLVEVESDKAKVEISSPFSGVVQEIFFKPSDVIKTGSTLLTVAAQDDGSSSADSAAAAPIAAPSAAAPSAADAPVAAGVGRGSDKYKALATPAVRRIAKENNLDISKVQGTGPFGRVLKGDILAYLQSPAPSTPAAAPAAAPAATPKPSYAVPAAQKQDTVVPVRGVMRVMTKTMTAAWAVPHFGYSDEVVMDGLIALRKDLKEMAAARSLKFSYLPVILKATSLALKSFPMLNATVDAAATEVVYRASHNIGVAMDTPRGLLVPNVKGVQDLSLFEIAKELARLQEAGAAGKLTEADLGGGTFTLSNIGAIGGTYTSPVLMMPQVVIGALGRVQRVPRFAGDSNTVVPAHIMNVSWSGDHRVVDGATLARFSNQWKGYLENTNRLLADLK